MTETSLSMLLITVSATSTGFFDLSHIRAGNVGANVESK